MSSVENIATATVNTPDFELLERLERNTADFIECSKEEIATPPLQAFFDATTERIMKQFVKAFGFQLVEQFRTVYGIEDSVEEISKKVGLDDVAVTRTKATKKTTTTKAKTTTKKTAAPKWEKPSVPLPWTGERLADPETCLAIRPTQNLFSQCVNKKEGDGMYCKTCQAQADKNETGKPNAGDVEDREAGELFEYTPPGTDKPRKVQQYGNILEKAEKKAADKGEDTSKFSRENVELEATMFGLTIPEEFWAVKKAKRGRKSKSDSEESGSDEDSKKKAENSLLDAIDTEPDTKETGEEKTGFGKFGYDEDELQGLPELEEVEDDDAFVKAVEKSVTESKSDDETKSDDDESKSDDVSKSDDDETKSDDETKKSKKKTKSDDESKSDDETKKSKKKSKAEKKSKKSKKKVSKREKKTTLGKYEIELTRNDDGDKVLWVTYDGTTNEIEGKYTIKNGKVYDSDKDEVTEEMLDQGFEE